MIIDTLPVYEHQLSPYNLTFYVLLILSVFMTLSFIHFVTFAAINVYDVLFKYLYIENFV